MPRIAPQLALDAVSGDTSAAFNLGVVYSKFSMQVTLGGSPSGGTVSLLGSLDGTHFDSANPLATFVIGTDTSGAVKFSIDRPISAYEVVLSGFEGTGTVTAVVGIDATG